MKPQCDLLSVPRQVTPWPAGGRDGGGGGAALPVPAAAGWELQLGSSAPSVCSGARGEPAWLERKVSVTHQEGGRC